VETPKYNLLLLGYGENSILFSVATKIRKISELSSDIKECGEN
jgi:hypothetical protein